jgi:hypothetical protein
MPIAKPANLITIICKSVTRISLPGRRRKNLISKVAKANQYLRLPAGKNGSPSPCAASSSSFLDVKDQLLY